MLSEHSGEAKAFNTPEGKRRGLRMGVVGESARARGKPTGIHLLLF